MRIKTCFYTHGENQEPYFEATLRECFAQLKNLKVINLSYSNLTDGLLRGLGESIGSMKVIEKINLKQCGVTHESIDLLIDKLASNPNDPTLISLNLSGNNLQGMSKMGKFLAKSNSAGTLERLKMASCKLGDPELKQLSQGLMISRSLRVLDLSQNNVRNVGHIKEGIICNIGLEKLDLSNNQIDNEGLTRLSEALASNKGIETLAIAFNKNTLSGLKRILALFQPKPMLPPTELGDPQAAAPKGKD